MVLKKLRRCERGSDDAAILRKAERALRAPMLGLFNRDKPKKSHGSPQGA